MAKFTNGDLRLRDGQKVTFGDSLDSNLWWDGANSELRLDTTISGVTPTQDYHLTTKAYVDAISGSVVIDHGNLTGLLDDDHLQYVPVNGSRGFTSTVSGVDPTHSYDLTTKNYVDVGLANVSGSIITDHGQLTGLSDDDHTQYILADGTRNFTGIVSYASHPNFTSNTQLVDKEYVDNVVNNLDWQDSAINFQNTPPGSPSIGDRYVVVSGTGVWSGHDDDVAEWNGSSWDFTTPNEGFALWDETGDRLMTYNGTAWVKFGSTITHNNLNGLQGGTSGEYYHLSQTSYNALTSVGGVVNASSEHIHDDRYYTESEVDTVSSIYTVYYLHEEDSDIDGYKILSEVPSNHDETYDEVTISVADGETLVCSHVTASGVPNTTHVIAGTWVWVLWADVNAVSQGPHYLRAKWYRREQNGTEHLLFEQEQEIISTTPTRYQVETSISGIVMSVTDRLVLKTYAETSANSNRTIRYYLEGTDHATRYNTPVYANCTYDHGNLSGLADDDHPQYVRVDGSRGFTATISGIDPSHSYDLATKNYVDNRTIYRIHEHGRQAIANGSSQVSIAFNTALSNTNYTVNATLENTIDSPPSIYAFSVTSKTTTGFTVTLAGTTDSANYVLNWFVISD